MSATKVHWAYYGSKGLLKTIVVDKAPSAEELDKVRDSVITVQDGAGGRWHLKLPRFEEFTFYEGAIVLEGMLCLVVDPDDPEGLPIDMVDVWGLYNGKGSDLRLNMD